MKTYNERKMIEFGKYLRSKDRNESIENNHAGEDEEVIEERKREVYHSDLENFEND